MTGAQRNSNWQANVRTLLREGYGVEDIARRLRCSAENVRREVEILRAEGWLKRTFGGGE